LTPICPHLDRNLVGGSADAAWFYFQGRCGIAHGLLENLKPRAVRFFFQSGQGRVDNPLGNALLATNHYAVDESGKLFAPIPGIGHDLPALCSPSSGHNDRLSC
jgi:hypothetical protein